MIVICQCMFRSGSLPRCDSACQQRVDNKISFRIIVSRTAVLRLKMKIVLHVREIGIVTSRDARECLALVLTA
jgi:hypothetical protein